MRLAHTSSLLLVALLWQPLLPLSAQETSPTQQRIQKLIEDLGATEFEVREAARVSLEKIGLPAEAALRQATQNKDPQIQQTARRLLRTLGTIKLPAPIDDLAVADAGRVLVLKLQGQKGFSVYDTKTQKLKTVELPSADFTLGAGGKVAVVFLKETVELRSYNLDTLKMVESKEFVDPVEVMCIVMGHSRGDLAFLRVGRRFEQASNTTNHLLDVRNLRLIRPKNQKRLVGRNSSYSNFVHHRANGDLSHLTEWCTSHSPTGVYLYTRNDDTFELVGNHASSGFLAMGDDNKIYTGYGQIMAVGVGNSRPGPTTVGPNGALGTQAAVAGRSLLPGIGGRFYLGLSMEGNLELYKVGETALLCSLDPFPEWKLPRDPRQPAPRGQNATPSMAEQYLKTPMTLDKRVIFAPAAGHVVFVPHSNDRLIQRGFDLEGALEKTGKNYLLVLSNPPRHAKSGAEWDYQLNALGKHDPLTFGLESAPEGMKLSPEGKLSWKIPRGIRGEADVVVTVTDDKAHIVRQSFTIAFE